MDICSTTAAPRTAPALYLDVVKALDLRRIELGWSMQQLDAKSGLQDGYFAKLRYPDTPSGRIARWETVQLACDALYPPGQAFRFVVLPAAMLTSAAPFLAAIAQLAGAAPPVDRPASTVVGLHSARTLEYLPSHL